jgi:hypothetical protein
MLFSVLIFAGFLAVKVNAIIPLPCANVESLGSRTCCPVPDQPGAGPCGANHSRGSCEPISISESEFVPSETDIRKKWPIQYFNRICKCNENYGGFDCGECSFGYNDGGACETKTVLPRVSVGAMDTNDWTDYRAALRAVKDTPSRYMVAISDFTEDIQALNDSLVRPNTYDLFIWIHHLVAKDNEFTKYTDGFTDYAHEGPGFPTWHRLFLLWLEREIQIEISDHTFRLPYWEWSDPSQREIPFTRDRLGENVESVVQGDLFTNWDTYCWEDMMLLSYPVNICDPTVPTNEALRRCPSVTLCKMDNPNWPSTTDVKYAVSIDTYDAYPYNRSVKGVDTSFRNYMEGFIVNPDNCDEDTLCSRQEGRAHENITRKLHNTVHILLGVGDVKDPPPFELQGVMSCVAASPNDPVFINHHGKIDFILEEWLVQNKDDLSYPQDDRIRHGHRGSDYIVPFIPLYTHEDMFKTADNFGYEYLDTGGTGCPRSRKRQDPSCTKSSSFDGRVYILTCVGHILLGLSIVLAT